MSETNKSYQASSPNEQQQQQQQIQPPAYQLQEVQKPPTQKQQPEQPDNSQQSVQLQPAGYQQVPMAILVGLNFTETPRRMYCPYCNADIITSRQFVNGTYTLVLMLVLLIFTGGLCCLIPLCLDGCKDVRHSCPNCNGQLGVYKRM